MANDANATQLQELYVAYFGRAADPTGLEYWTKKGISQADFAAQMYAQPEFESAYGSKSTENQVNQIYKNLFDREADVTGLTYWTQQINSGVLQLAEIATHLIYAAKNNEGSEDDKTALTNRTAAAEAYTAKVGETTAAILAYTPDNDGKAEGATYVAGDAVTEAISYLSGIDKDTAHTDEGIAASVTTVTTEAVEVADSKAFTLTTNVDTFTGDSGADSFSGSNTTLTAGDTLDGGAGADTLTVASAATATLGGFTVTGIETVNVSASGGASTVDILQVTGATTVAAIGSSQNVTINNINDLPTLKLANNSAGNVTFANLAGDVDGTADSQTLEIASSVNGTVTVASVETLNVVNSGTSTITTLTTTASETLNLSGSGDLTLTNIDDAVKVIDGSGYTGKVTYGGIGSNDMTITGGSGADTFDFTGGNPTSSDIVDGEDGTDVLKIDVGLTSSTAIKNFSNVEKLHLDYNHATQDATISAALFDEIEIQVGDASNGGDSVDITVNNAKSTQSILLDDDAATEVDDANDGVTLTVTQAIGAGTTSDVLNLTLEGETLLTATANEYETVNISSDVATNTIKSLDTNLAQSIVVTGSKNLTLTALDMEEQSTTKTSILDASALTGKLTFTMTNDEGDQTITGGTNDDTMTFAGNYLDTDDTVTGGAGTDTFTITDLAGDIGEVNLDVERVTLELTTASNSTIDLRNNTSLERVTIDLDDTDSNITVNNMQADTSVIIQNKVAATTDIVTLDGASGVTAMSVTFDEEEATAHDFQGRLTANFDTLTLKTNDSITDISIAVLSGSTIDTLNLQGSGDITITSATNTTSIDTLDASTMTGAVTLTSLARHNNATIKLGGAGDSVNFVTTSHAGNTITAGSGTDTLVFTGATSSNLVIDLASSTDQVTNVAAAANTAAQTGFENVTATGVTSAGITLTGSSDGNTVLGSLQADTITAGSGALAVTGDDGGDIITLTASTGRDTLTVAAGDSLGSITGSGNTGAVASYDIITGFNVGTTASAKDSLNMAVTATLATAGSYDGTNSTLTATSDTLDDLIIATDGEVTFSDASDTVHIAANGVNSNSLLAAAIQSLQGTDIGTAGATVWFTGTISSVAHTWVYTQDDTIAGGDFVDLSGVTATSIETTASTTANIVFIA